MTTDAHPAASTPVVLGLDEALERMDAALGLPGPDGARSYLPTTMHVGFDTHPMVVMLSMSQVARLLEMLEG